MGNYENGISTRRIILDTCKELFYEKGFHNTSQNDICKLSHVNRSAIHYHFKEMENIRYEVMWELMTKNRHMVAQYCDDPKFEALLAVYIMWVQILKDSKTRRFMVEHFTDYPLYRPNTGPGRFYITSYSHMYGSVWALEKIDELSFASVYGHLKGVLQLADEHPEHYTPVELYKHCIVSGTTIWGIPKEQVDALWNKLLSYIEQIPIDNIDTSLR